MGGEAAYRIIHDGYRVEVSALGGGDFRLSCDEAEFRAVWYDYFDLGESYRAIRARISREEDPFLFRACGHGRGIRILRQEPWEALCTFIISQNNNIKRIKGIVSRLCENFGESIGSGYGFPTAAALSRLAPDDLAPLRAGFRNKYIIDAAKKVAGGEVDLELCRTLPYEDARLELMKIKGVGVKVADCALLFGFYRVDAFPKDVWVKRVMAQWYPNGLPSCTKGLEGIAQQYLFHYIRSLK